MNTTEFDPIFTANKLTNSYKNYISSTIHFADKSLQQQLEDILDKPGYLAKGPFLEAAPPYHKDQSVRELIIGGTLCESMLSLGGRNPEHFDVDRPLYTHQVRAIKKAVAGRNYAVVTGTGSGKTECFLLPILNDILSEFEESGFSSGVRAMILYPMNALANDQLKRLRMLLEGTDVTFGRYTGDTPETQQEAVIKWKAENPEHKKLPNEIISREEIRKNPPNILLTNYSMLEYLLLRPKDAPLFGKAFGSKWRHLAIDEAHIYSGSLGTEIAYLLRRLKARIESEVGTAPSLHCYATSATIGTENDMPKVAAFVQDLFGEPFSQDPDNLDVITSNKDYPQDALDDEPWGSLPLPTWIDLRHILDDLSAVDLETLRKVLREAGTPKDVVDLISTQDPLVGLGKILLGEQSTARLVNRCATLLDLTDLSAIDSIGINGLIGDETGIKTITAMVEVLSAAQRSKGIPILSSRYHSFLRAPEGMFLNLATHKLIPHKTTEEPYDADHTTPVYETAVCRHCGQAYILGQEETTEQHSVVWLNPRHEGTDADDEFIPSKYYRILANEEEKDAEEDIIWLCPICGSLHDEQTGGLHRFQHTSTNRLPIALSQSVKDSSDDKVAKCKHCGYQSAIAIQSMRVSPEAAGSVVCYELVRDIPPFEENEPQKDSLFTNFAREEHRAGSVICFSDRRQDAAFFAPAFDRSYSSITRRQLIREAVDTKDDGEGCSVTSVINWIASVAKKRYPDLFNGDEKDKATAWMLDELSAEDSRNSLEGLGVIRIEATKFNEGFFEEQVRQVIQHLLDQLPQNEKNKLTIDDFIIICKVGLEFLRQRNAIESSEEISTLRNNHSKRGNRVVLGGEEYRGMADLIRFTGSGTGTSENALSSFLRKYIASRYNITTTRNEAVVILQTVFKFLSEYLGDYFQSEKFLIGQKDQFTLNMNIWSLYSHKDTDIVYRCNKCGCETHLDTHGVCTTFKCDGTLVKMSFADAQDKDKYYKEVYQQEALPLDVEEHTAQLSSESARTIQEDFIKGKVNILSCTTTFELGVDVGDLRAIFMRNVPPSTANYTQRVGRVGRRAGMPGYAITFARLRPHDIAFFSDPSRMISGETRVPVCYLDNSAIAQRHIFATALSEFFRASLDTKGIDYSRCYHDFLDLSTDAPLGLDQLRNYLQTHPHSVEQQIDRILPPITLAPSISDLTDWKWIDALVEKPTDSNTEHMGRLVRTHLLKHSDYDRVQEGIEINQGTDDWKASALLRTRNTLKKEATISVLAQNGVLPKYGFPTDLIELHLPSIDQSTGANRLSLSRGMRQAITEYAPGSEVVAQKNLWKSVGIKKPKGRELEIRRYGECPKCGTFAWPIENYVETETCKVCGTKFTLNKKMLIPSYGFEGKKSTKGIGLRKPRSQGFASVYFSQHWPHELITQDTAFDGGVVYHRYASNGQLCVLNAPKGKFWVCGRCGATSVGGEDIDHFDWCRKDGITPTSKAYDALGASFVSDVLELDLDINSDPQIELSDWESVMWALFAASADMLEVPETELGGTIYKNSRQRTSILIYDNVPGGAGHTYQLSKNVRDLFKNAYRVVDGHCGCGEETCCYGCIANYYNQSRQADLSRGTAKRVLDALINNQPFV